MSFTGTVKGNTIELDEPLPFADGTPVKVIVCPEEDLRKGSPKAILKLLSGTLTPEEAEAIRSVVSEIRRIDLALWEYSEK